MSKHVLVTGFEAFGGDLVNPSDLVARELADRLIAGRRLVARTLPVDSTRLRPAMQGTLRELGVPDLVISLGMAAGRSGLALERTAVNVLDFEMADNAGTVVRGSEIVRDGVAACFTNLPVDRIISAWEAAGVPGYLSESAGTFICNQLFYEVLCLLHRSTLAGFIHLPCLPQLAVARGAARTPSMSLELMVRGVELAIATTLEWCDEAKAHLTLAAVSDR